MELCSAEEKIENDAYRLWGESSSGYERGPGGTTICRTPPGFIPLMPSSRPGTKEFVPRTKR